MVRAIVLREGDNVATLIDNGGEKGTEVTLRGEAQGTIKLGGEIPFGQQKGKLPFFARSVTWRPVLLANTEGGENSSEQIVAGELPDDFSETALRESQLLGNQTGVGACDHLLMRDDQVLLGLCQRLKMPSSGDKGIGVTLAVPHAWQQALAQQLDAVAVARGN